MTTDRDTTLAGRVLDYCRTPRTAAQVHRWFADDRARFAVYNLTARGHLTNLRPAPTGSRRAGLFIDSRYVGQFRHLADDAAPALTAGAPVPPPAALRRARPEPEPEFTRLPAPGADLAAAWGVGARR